ncbi:Trichodiene synthase [Termitomyces sp. J132]|nr:Trichodiene synthase [Termitomyces sp. J132]
MSFSPMIPLMNGIRDTATSIVEKLALHISKPKVLKTMISLTLSSKKITSPDVTPVGHRIHDVARIVQEFLITHSYMDHLKMNVINEELEYAMRVELEMRKIISVQLDKTLHLAASLIELAFRDCTFEEKLNMALYNWSVLAVGYLLSRNKLILLSRCVIYTDDVSTKDVVPFVAFQQRFLRGQPQLDPVLKMFADVMHRMCDQLPPLFANLWLSATFEFITATCAESEIGALRISPRAKRFPAFLRDRTGLGVPYALMIYPKSRPVDFVTCFQVLPEMNFWIAAINDILSFYKEELAGETANYIYNRARAQAMNPLDMFLTVRDELLEASENVTKALSVSSPKALDAWKNFESGVIAWHLQQDRYKLNDLQF